MRALNNRQGFSLVEVLIATAISVVGASLCFFFIQNIKTHKAGVDQTLAVKEVLADNVIEAKGALLADLPNPGQCLIRTYNDRKEFQTESLVSASPCPKGSMANDQMQIIWEVSPPAEIAATFSSSALKIPKLSTTLKQVTIHAWNYTGAGKKHLTHSQIVIFRK